MCQAIEGCTPYVAAGPSTSVSSGGSGTSWEAYAIANAPGLVVGDLMKFVGLAPSKEILVGALREAGLG